MAAAAAAERTAMVWEPLPSAGGPEADTGAGDWECAGIAERLSAAGAAPAAADVVLAGSSAAVQRGEARVNPPGHVWVSTVSRAMLGSGYSSFGSSGRARRLTMTEMVWLRRSWIRCKSLRMISRS